MNDLRVIAGRICEVSGRVECDSVKQHIAQFCREAEHYTRAYTTGRERSFRSVYLTKTNGGVRKSSDGKNGTAQSGAGSDGPCSHLAVRQDSR